VFTRKTVFIISDLITRFGSLTCELVTPLVALNNQEIVLLTAMTQRDLVVIDLTVNTMLYKLSLDSTNETQCGLEPSFVSENLAALCERNSGSVFLHDVRAGKTCGSFSPGKKMNCSRINLTFFFFKTSMLCHSPGSSVLSYCSGSVPDQSDKSC
jgi:hypothetical protein